MLLPPYSKQVAGQTLSWSTVMLTQVATRYQLGRLEMSSHPSPVLFKAVMSYSGCSIETESGCIDFHC